MKHRKSLIFFAVVCIICGILLIASSCTAAAGGVSAAAVDTNVTLTTAQTLALFGDSINCEYLSTAGIYKPLVLEYEGNHHVVSENQTNTLGVSVADRDFIAYRALMPSDIDVTPSNMRISIETACDLSGVTYVDTAFLQMTNLSLGTILQTSYPNNYWYTSAGYFRSAGQTNDPDLFGYCVNTYNLNFTIIPVMYSAPAASDFKFGYISASSFNNYTVNNGYAYFGIVCPVLSDGYTHSGNSGAGSGSESSGGGSDTSGVESRLDTIIAKLDTIIAEMNDDDDSSGETTTPPGGDTNEPFATEPIDFDYDAAAAAAQPAYDMPFLAPSDTPTGGSGMAIQDGGGIAPPESVDPVDVSSESISGGIGLLWYLLQSVLNVVPVYSRLIMANLAISLAVYFIFRGGND